MALLWVMKFQVAQARYGKAMWHAKELKVNWRTANMAKTKEHIQDEHIRTVSGILEVFYNGIWGTVCDDNFDDIDARVACKELGYNDGYFVGSQEYRYNVKRTIWLDNVDCLGNEDKLVHCTHAGWGVENCSPYEHVKIKCNNADEEMEMVLENTKTGGNLKVWLSNVRCYGGENKLTDCSHSDWGSHHCSHDKVVGIRCGEGQGDVRINSGRLEIYYNGTWGTVCNASIGDEEATVACRQLGYK
ncbi:unnamed protein product [Mytilus edulis]|uniref:SRCR domain-containing protein n=1 Tax=Mytilus edulis TaxID=6550 RepID=A0A8S3SGM1_MYTED|nr:unnamed protein product [Mytilus edulis]